MHVYIAFVAHTAIFVLGTSIFSRIPAILTATRFSQLPNTSKQRHPPFTPHTPPSISSPRKEPCKATPTPLKKHNLPLQPPLLPKSPSLRSNMNRSFVVSQWQAVWRTLSL